ncbi:MAG: hypothetical protein BroJett002_37290 [Candidatus Brocadia sinica]|nr:MAG: hypothetical protein BroJett002_37290 [Candidatus Brocadia sinica]
MVNEIAVNQGTGEILEAKTIAITSEQIELVKNTIAKGATDDELRLFIYYCKSRGVHPLDKMIHFVKRKSDDGFVATFQTGIDYFRSSAEDSGEYNGQEGAEFEGETNEGYPYLARVKIYRKGIDRAFVGEARWDEFYPGEKLGFMWRKMPHHMLAKCAEALAFRKAFPKKLAGLYIPEEVQSVEAHEIKDKKPEVRPPQIKEPTKPEPQKVITSIKAITQKPGKNNSVRYKIAGETADYFTFDAKYATLAKSAQDATLKVEIQYKVGNFGNDITGMDIVEPNLNVEAGDLNG